MTEKKGQDSLSTFNKASRENLPKNAPVQAGTLMMRRTQQGTDLGKAFSLHETTNSKIQT